MFFFPEGGVVWNLPYTQVASGKRNAAYTATSLVPQLSEHLPLMQKVPSSIPRATREATILLQGNSIMQVDFHNCAPLDQSMFSTFSKDYFMTKMSENSSQLNCAGCTCGQQPYILEHPFTGVLDGSWLLGGCSLHRGHGVD